MRDYARNDELLDCDQHAERERHTTLCQKVRANTTPSCPRRSVTETPVAIF